MPSLGRRFHARHPVAFRQRFSFIIMHFSSYMFHVCLKKNIYDEHGMGSRSMHSYARLMVIWTGFTLRQRWKRNGGNEGSSQMPWNIVAAVCLATQTGRLERPRVDSGGVFPFRMEKAGMSVCLWLCVNTFVSPLRFACGRHLARSVWIDNKNKNMIPNWRLRCMQSIWLMGWNE